MDQPRVPAGSPEGGQFASKGGTARKFTSGDGDFSDKELRSYTKSVFKDELGQEDIALSIGAPPGSRVSIKENSSMNGLDVTVEIMGDDGFPIGTMQREVYHDTIVNKEFFLDKGFRGKGLGAKAFAQQVDEASKRGFRMIETTASGAADIPESGMNGYYTWARFGYDGSLSYKNGPNGEKTVHQIMSTPQGRDWWKANGYEFDGEFSLLPGSTSRRVFDEYRRLKGL